MTHSPEPGWETATWEGARRARLRAVLRLTVRERLEAIDDLAALSAHLAGMPKTQPPRSTPRQEQP